MIQPSAKAPSPSHLTDKERLEGIGHTAVKIWEVLKDLPYGSQRYAELVYYVNHLETNVRKIASSDSRDALENSKLIIRINNILQKIITETRASHQGILVAQRTQETPSERIRRSIKRIIDHQPPIIDAALASYRNLLDSHKAGLQIHLDTLWANLRNFEPTHQLKPPA